MISNAPSLSPAPTPTTPPPEPALPRSGWDGFDDLQPVAPGRITLLDVAAARGLDLAFGLLASTVAGGREAAVVDGGNRLDVYRLGSAARRLGAPREAAFDGVRVARGFTAYQVQALVEDALPGILGPATGLLAALELPELYQDEDLDRAEACALLARALRTLGGLARAWNVPCIVTNASLAPGRLRLRSVLDEGVDEVVRLLPAPDAGLRVALPRRGVTVLAPAPGARQVTLDAFGARARAPLGEEAAFRQRVPADPRIVRGPRRRQELRALAGHLQKTVEVTA